MGFGVSGATAIIFLALLISASAFYTTAASSAEQLREATDSDHERLLDRQNTAVDLSGAAYYTGNQTLRVEAVNTGTTTLSVNDSTMLVDNDYYSTATATVEGDEITDLWLPGESLVLELSTPAAPSRAKLISETGVSDAEQVVVT
ncbi:MAG: fla cluster protein FlaF [Halobacteriota archaeon]